MKIWQHFALFSWQKSSNASPQVRHSTQNAILTKLSSWEYSNGDAPFSRWKSDRVSHLVCYCTPTGFHAYVTTRANMLVLGRAGAPKSIKHIDTCRIHGETDATKWHGLRRSHRGDHAHSMTWICTYSKCLEHILIPKCQENSWLERVAYIRVHHTKCTITHTHTNIYINASCTMLSHRARK